MKFGRVVGTVVCTQQAASLRGIKLNLVQALDAYLVEQEEIYTAADGTVGAGSGDVVVVVFKGDAPDAFAREQVPVDASIVGIVDPDSVRQIRDRGHDVVPR